MAEMDELSGSGFTIKGDEVPKSFRVEAGIEHIDQQAGGSAAPFTHSASVSVAAASPTADRTKKKRGRPRKYGADGSILTLSPMPISASIPLTGDYSSWKSSFRKKHKLEFEGGGMAYPAVGGLMSHLLTVNPGEDIMKKTISFSQQGYRAICILAANGSVSNATLRQPNSSGGTLTYEGLFAILSLTGLFLPNDDGVTKSRTGGMSVLLAGPDGRVLGGGLAGMLVAAGPVQVVIGSFIPRDQQEQKPKKHNFERTISFAAPNACDLVDHEERFGLFYSVTDPNLTSSTPLPRDNPPVVSKEPVFKILPSENTASLPEQTPREQSHEITC